MSGEPEIPGVWQRFRRRRVTRTAVSYVVVAFALLEGVWLLVGRLGLPSEVGRVVTGIVVLGFPLSVVLAWTYDVTPRGIVRTPDEFDTEPDTPPPLVRHSVWLLLCLLVAAAGLVLRSLRM